MLQKNGKRPANDDAGGGYPDGLGAQLGRRVLAEANGTVVIEGAGVRAEGQADGGQRFSVQVPATGVLMDGEYTFVARVIDEDGNVSDDSAPVQVVIDTIAPSPPTGPTATPGRGYVDLAWEPNTEGDLLGYIVERSPLAPDDWRPITPQPIRGTRFRDTSVTDGTRYRYRVRACDTAEPEQ